MVLKISLPVLTEGVILGERDRGGGPWVEAGGTLLFRTESWGRASAGGRQEAGAGLA